MWSNWKMNVEVFLFNPFGIILWKMGLWECRRQFMMISWTLTYKNRRKNYFIPVFVHFISHFFHFFRRFSLVYYWVRCKIVSISNLSNCYHSIFEGSIRVKGLKSYNPIVYASRVYLFLFRMFEKKEKNSMNFKHR